jgi:putative transposase
MNHKKLYRLYTDEKLGVRRRKGRKRARGSRTPMPVALRPGERWSLDFVSDTFGASRKFRMLAVNDDCCRENLCLMVDTSISGARVPGCQGGTGAGCACVRLWQTGLHCQ